MKKVNSNVSYRVPNWNFCNVDVNPTNDKSLKQTCRFCINTKQGPMCVLHNETLSTNNGLVAKTETCKEISAGFKVSIEEAEVQEIQVDPKVLIKQTIELYQKHTENLVAQGYPVAIAQGVAKDYMLGGNK